MVVVGVDEHKRTHTLRHLLPGARHQWRGEQPLHVAQTWERNPVIQAHAAVISTTPDAGLRAGKHFGVAGAVARSRGSAGLWRSGASRAQKRALRSSCSQTSAWTRTRTSFSASFPHRRTRCFEENQSPSRGGFEEGGSRSLCFPHPGDRGRGRLLVVDGHLTGTVPELMRFTLEKSPWGSRGIGLGRDLGTRPGSS